MLNLVHGFIAFGTPKVYIASYGKLNHQLVNMSSNCDLRSGLNLTSLAKVFIMYQQIPQESGSMHFGSCVNSKGLHQTLRLCMLVTWSTVYIYQGVRVHFNILFCHFLCILFSSLVEDSFLEQGALLKERICSYSNKFFPFRFHKNESEELLPLKIYPFTLSTFFSMPQFICILG